MLRNFVVTLVWMIGGSIGLIFIFLGITERDRALLAIVPLTFALTFWIQEFVKTIFGENSIYDSEIYW